MLPRDRELYRWIERSPVGMYRCDEAGRLYYVNSALVQLLGYDSCEELLAQNLGRDIYAEAADRARLQRHVGSAGCVNGARVRWRTKQGNPLVVLIHGHLTDTPDGMRCDVSVVDVTGSELQKLELDRLRGALAATQQLLDSVARQMKGIYWVVDRDLRVCQSGGAIPELLGYGPGRHRGQTVPEAYQVDHADPGTLDPTDMHRRALAGETVVYTTEHRNRHLITTISPLRHGGASDDAIEGAVGSCVDTTAHYLLERRMVDAQRAESLGVLASGLAHDFNNLLVAILGNADLALRELPLRAPGRAPLENIRQASLRAAELTEQLLAYAGHGSVVPGRVSPSALVEELLRISAPTMPANISVTTDIAGEVMMRGDASQIRQVLLNLINNARDALGPRGGAIVITGRLRRHDGVPQVDDVMTPNAGTYVELEVIDDGPGMSSETRRRIFEPFFTTKPTGHGLGLASVVGIVRAHGGGLRLTTAPAAGARFSVLWRSTVTPSEVAVVPPPVATHTVLIVDDEDLVRDVVARMIEDLGYTAITAPDGPSGLTIVDNMAIDAVLVDLTMPQMSGTELVSALRARRPGLPIILCSGFERDRRAVAADAYLAKPFRIETLDHTLARLLPR